MGYHCLQACSESLEDLEKRLEQMNYEKKWKLVSITCIRSNEFSMNGWKREENIFWVTWEDI